MREGSGCVLTITHSSSVLPCEPSHPYYRDRARRILANQAGLAPSARHQERVRIGGDLRHRNDKLGSLHPAPNSSNKEAIKYVTLNIDAVFLFRNALNITP